MKMYVLSDNTDTWMGMRLAGIDGAVAHTAAEVQSKVEELLSDGETGIILITEKLRSAADAYISNLMMTRNQPLFLEIPDRHGFGRSKTSITDYIKRTIGLNI